jgi:hypothetical protein
MKHKYLLTCFKSLIALAGLGVLLGFADWDNVLTILKTADFFRLSLSLVLLQLSVIVFALRSNLLFKFSHCPIKLFDSYRIYQQSIFYAFFFPSLAAGDAVQYLKLKKLFQDEGKIKILSILVLGRGGGIASAGIIAGILFIYMDTEVELLRGGRLWNIALLLGIFFILVLIAVMIIKRARLFLAKYVDLIKKFPFLFLCACICSMAMHCIMAGGLAVGQDALRITGIDYWEILFVMCCGVCSQVFPLTVAGAGANELVTFSLYKAMGLGGSEALLMVSMLYLFRLLNSIIGGGCELSSSLKLLSIAKENHWDG